MRTGGWLVSLVTSFALTFGIGALVMESEYPTSETCVGAFQCGADLATPSVTASPRCGDPVPCDAGDGWDLYTDSDGRNTYVLREGTVSLDQGSWDMRYDDCEADQLPADACTFGDV